MSWYPASGIGARNLRHASSEARIAKLQAEVAALEAQLAELTAVAPERFQRREIVPSSRDVTVLRHDLLWV